MSMRHVVITGATSMIGAALTGECLRQGIKVTAVLRPDSKKTERLPKHPNLKTVFCDIDDMKRLPALLKEEYDTFYHIAWGYTGSSRNKSTFLQSQNIEYTLNAVKAAKEIGCSRFIGAGSQAEYGPCDLEKISPDTPEHPTTPYGVSKLAAGKLAFLLCRELEMECIWPRIFSVYGIYDKESSMVMSSVKKFLAGEETSFTPAGQRWEYLYSKDAGRAFYLIGEYGKDGSIYCVGSGKARPLKEFIYEIRDASCPQAEPGIGARPYPPGAVMNLCADIGSLMEDTGFIPRYEFREGIQETVRWFKERKQ